MYAGGAFFVSIRGAACVELFYLTDPWTTQSLWEVLTSKYGKGTLETQLGRQLFLSDRKLTSEQVADLAFCPSLTQGK